MNTLQRTTLIAVIFAAISTGYGYSFYYHHFGIETIPFGIPGFVAGGLARESIYYATYNPKEMFSDKLLNQIGTWICGITTFIYLSVLFSPFILNQIGILMKWRKLQIIFATLWIPATFLLLIIFVGLSFPRQS